MKTAFIGHRNVLAKNISTRISEAILQEIKGGCRVFTMGTHGEFDRLALNVCRQLKNTYKDLEIEVIITSFNEIKKCNELNIAPYSDVKTTMYDIEDVYFKRRITLSNQRMIDSCDTLICYVNPLSHKSGAKRVLRYAEKRGLKIINLYREEDQPLYGMTKEQINEFLNNFPDAL